jgi:hypothetical protein
VESADDLWDVEQYRPWTEPLPLQPDQTGSLGGARTFALTRRGNIVFSLTLAPLIQPRESLSPEQIQASEANLDSLGFTFDHPSFVMAPGFELMARLPDPLGGTTHYVLHFGDLTGEGDVLYTMAAGPGGPLQLSFPATKTQLDKLQAGEPLSLTALRVPAGEEPQAETTAVFTLTLLQVGQATNSAALLEYMKNGSLNRDLKALIPPGGVG